MTDDVPSATDNEPVFEYSIAENELASTAVLLSISDVTDTPIEDLPSLTGVVDTELLDGLYASFEDDNGEVSFTYHGFGVTIYADGHIELRRRDG